ncbi:exopolysaccharide biosynthesis protein [Fischerella sp. JS2]|uniref:exopolysaccharide biosynthesis protein n=1 Tax=Fischerella sp. JS2 TaxID=2597771 RepID=UPI0028E6C397|nr:exopolysaccharide biosynthesis protein [Fischerella sp. JS2]
MTFKKPFDSHHQWAQTTSTSANATSPPQEILYRVAHAIVGRIRFCIPRLATDSEYADQLKMVMESDYRITDVRINPLAASIVINYTSELICDQQMRSDLVNLIQAAANTVLIPLVRDPQTDSNTVRVSELLRRFLDHHQGDEVRLRDLFNFMGSRSFGPTLLICALPEALPLPIAGISALVAMPLLLVSGQLVLGFSQPWLPDWLLDQPFKGELCQQVISGAIPVLEKLECFFEPRWSFFTSPEAQRCVGVILLLLGFIIALPIPFGNMLPAIAIVVICLGLIDKDGLIIAISSLITGITVALLLLVL